MALPDPQSGLVISYSYLWHYEHNVGRDEGAKTRPCVIVLAVDKPEEGTTVVRVAPITHSPPRIASALTARVHGSFSTKLTSSHGRAST
ncbi:MAG: hypothetical protein ABSA58_23700 [Acetobacteraceae bacterium]